MKWFRIVEEGDGEDGKCYRIQERGWFRWRDMRYIASLGPPGGLPLTSILRFNTVEKAKNWIENQGRRNESIKVVIGTFGVYG